MISTLRTLNQAPALFPKIAPHLSDLKDLCFMRRRVTLRGKVFGPFRMAQIFSYRLHGLSIVRYYRRTFWWRTFRYQEETVSNARLRYQQSRDGHAWF